MVIVGKEQRSTQVLVTKMCATRVSSWTNLIQHISKWHIFHLKDTKICNFADDTTPHAYDTNINRRLRCLEHGTALCCLLVWKVTIWNWIQTKTIQKKLVFCSSKNFLLFRVLRSTTKFFLITIVYINQLK